jgi:hypothetical protein
MLNNNYNAKKYDPNNDVVIEPEVMPGKDILHQTESEKSLKGNTLGTRIKTLIAGAVVTAITATYGIADGVKNIWPSAGYNSGAEVGVEALVGSQDNNKMIGGYGQLSGRHTEKEDQEKKYGNSIANANIGAVIRYKPSDNSMIGANAFVGLMLTPHGNSFSQYGVGIEAEKELDNIIDSILTRANFYGTSENKKEINKYTDEKTLGGFDIDIVGKKGGLEISLGYTSKENIDGIKIGGNYRLTPNLSIQANVDLSDFKNHQAMLVYDLLGQKNNQNKLADRVIRQWGLDTTYVNKTLESPQQDTTSHTPPTTTRPREESPTINGGEGEHPEKLEEEAPIIGGGEPEQP